MNVQSVEISPGTRVLYVGPPLEEGPMPTLFYFALSAEDSLQKDPYNQPVQFLKGSPVRIFSMTLPGHEDNLPPENAINVWKERMAKGESVIPPFINKVREAIDLLTPHFQEGKFAVAGLSRGAFIACHVAAICPQISHILGYAPLTRIKFGDGSLDLEFLIPQLRNRIIRFYIGNSDTRVGTENAFSFIHKLAKAAQESKIRSPPQLNSSLVHPLGIKGMGQAPQFFKVVLTF